MPPKKILSSAKPASTKAASAKAKSKPASSKSKPASAKSKPASAKTASSSVKKVVAKRPASAPAAMRERSPKSECLTKVYEGYRALCAKKGADCPLVKECSQHGVGSESWPVTMWHIPTEQWDTLSPDDRKRIMEGKKCMSEAMKKDDMLIKALDENCSKYDVPPKKPSSARAASSPPAAPSAVGGARCRGGKGKGQGKRAKC